MRWLVVRGGALGDLLLTVPAVARLAAQASHLTLAATPRYAALFPGLAHEVMDLRGPESLWLFGSGHPRGPLPDAALVYTPGVAETLRELGVQKVINWPATAPEGVHTAAHLLAAVADLPAVPSPRPVGRLVQLPCGPLPVVLAPGASAPDKRWLGFVALARLLDAADIPFVWAPGRDEDPIPDLPGPTLSGLDLPDLVGLAEQSGLWIGNDTGTTHLASACGAPVIALFGPTDPRRWAPEGALVLGFDTSPEALFQRALVKRRTMLDLPLWAR